MLEKGNNKLLSDTKTCADISNMAMNLINFPEWNEGMIHMTDLILRISNIAYNNTTNTILPSEIFKC
jgi:hypothetical protein